RTVAHHGVTVDAVRRLTAGRAMPENVIDQIVMAMETIGLKNARTHGPDANRLREILQREALGVPEAVLSLDQILGDQVMGYMAVIAGGVGVMTGLLPAVVLVAHDVAVDARLGVVAQVRKALGVVDGVGACPKRGSDQDAQK